MIKSIQKYIHKYVQKFSNIKYKKKLRKEKAKLYMTTSSGSNYVSKRNKFKLFTNKLEFQNAFEEIKNIHTYYYIIGTFLILASMYLLFFSHYFSIKNIDIIRQDDLINIDLSYRSVDYIRYEPILTQDKNKIEEALRSHQPNIKDVYIRKILPDNVKIVMSSYPSAFRFQNEGKNYLITDNGVIIPAPGKSNLPQLHIKDQDSLGIIDYKEVFQPEYIKRIKEIITEIREKNSFVKIIEADYYKKEAELHIINQDGTVIIFDLTKESSIQIQKLNIFYKEYRKKINQGIIYIDLRINEKIYYCSTDNEFQCKTNLKNIYN